MSRSARIYVRLLRGISAVLGRTRYARSLLVIVCLAYLSPSLAIVVTGAALIQMRRNQRALETEMVHLLALRQLASHHALRTVPPGVEPQPKNTARDLLQHKVTGNEGGGPRGMGL